MGMGGSYKATIASIIIFQIIIILTYAFLVDYDYNADPQTSFTNIPTALKIGAQYPMFQDVHVMVFVGFGFLMTFLKKYAFSSIGLTFLISSVVIQWSILLQGFCNFDKRKEMILISLDSIVEGDVAAATVLISLGAVLGKIGPLQLFYMAIIETGVYVGNKYVVEKELEATDVGGSMLVHAFGAYFGLAVSAVMGFRKPVESEKNKLESYSYQSEINSFIGTLFLWMFWPSFNAAIVYGDQKYRVILNTYLSLTASCIWVFAMSSSLNKNGKFEMVHIQNATLAGGVCVGAVCNMDIKPFGALIIGSFAGISSVFGFRFIQDCFYKKLRIHDTCGVHNLHGIPGVIGGLTGVGLTMFASKKTYGERLYEIYPAMAPYFLNRSALEQGGFQLAAVTITLSVAIVSGLLTGVLIGIAFPTISSEERYNDSLWWEEAEASEPD